MSSSAGGALRPGAGSPGRCAAYPAAAALLECHVPDPAFSGRERIDRPPDADDPDKGVKGVLLVAANQHRLPDRRPTQHRDGARYLTLVVLRHARLPVRLAATVIVAGRLLFRAGRA